MAGLIKLGNISYAVYYVGRKQKRVALQTDSLQIAKDKICQIESNQFRQEDALWRVFQPMLVGTKNT